MPSFCLSNLIKKSVGIMKECKSVCIIQNSIKTVVVFRLSYIKQLLSHGHKVYCIAPNDDNESVDCLKKYGVIVITTDNERLLYRYFFINLSLLRVLFKEKFKLTVSCHFLVTFIFSIPSIFFARKTVCFIEGIGTFFTKNKGFLNILRLLLTRGVGKRIFMNKYEKNLLGCDGDLVLGGIGVDIESFCYSYKIKKCSRKIELLYVGRLVEDKGIFYIIELIRHLKLAGVDFTLNVVGDTYPANPSSLTDDDIANLKAEFEEDIIFHGYLSDLRHIYAKTDVLLLLSKHEGFPVVVMEANACGIPAICYAVPGCIDAIEHGVNGFLFNEGEIEDIVKLISTQNFSLLATQCRNYAEKNFNQVIKNRAIIEAIESL